MSKKNKPKKMQDNHFIISVFCLKLKKENKHQCILFDLQRSITLFYECYTKLSSIE